MIYKGKPQSVLLSILIALVGVRVTIFKEPNVLNIIILIVIVFILCIQYQFQIDQNQLTYQIFLLRTPIYKREVVPEEIQEIRFIRVDWAKKSAIVRMKKGLNMRIILFHPDSVCKDLEQYAKENNVSIHKTRDYQIIERMK